MLVEEQLHFYAYHIYDKLVQYCDASNHFREDFITYFIEQCKKNEYGEFRFQGCLGFGGKIYFDCNEWKVRQYIEDESPETKDKIKEVNQYLSNLFDKYWARESPVNKKLN